MCPSHTSHLYVYLHTFELIAQCSKQELTASHDTVPLPPSPSKLHTSILLDPHGPYIGIHTDYPDITTFG